MSRLLTCLLLIAPFARPASAEEVRLVLIESYAGPRPAHMDHVTGVLTRTLALDGNLSLSIRASSLLEEQDSIAIHTDTFALDRAFKRIDDGLAEFAQSNFAVAKIHLEDGIRASLAESWQLAQSNQRRENLFHAMIKLARAYRRLNDGARATATMTEIMRSWPNRPVTKSEHGEEAATEYHRARKATASVAPANLRVNVTGRRGASIFVDESYRGVGQAALNGLTRGRHRVYAQHGQNTSRLHWVTVRPGETANLTIDWARDQALRTEGRVALEYRNEATRARLETSHAESIAKAVAARQVMVIASIKYKGREAFEGNYFLRMADKGLVLQRAAVWTHGGQFPEDQVNSFASLLRTGDKPPPSRGGDRMAVTRERTPEPVAGTVPDRDPEPRKSPSRRRDLFYIKWISLGVAVVGIGSVVTYRTFIHDGGFWEAYASTSGGIFEMTALSLGVTGALIAPLVFYLDSQEKKSAARRVSHLSTIPLPYVLRHGDGFVAGFGMRF
jgi:hypothetical protein